MSKSSIMSHEFPNILIFDIETIGNVSSPNFVQEMEVTVVGVYSYATGEYSTYFREDLPKLESELHQAHLLVGFNNDHFDTPILNKYYTLDLFAIPSFDILREFRAITGKRVGLNSIAGATLNMYKSGSGKEAIILYQDNKLDELAQYCLDDVRLTKEVFEYAIHEGYLRYTSRDGWLRFQVPFQYDLDQFIREHTIKSQHALL